MTPILVYWPAVLWMLGQVEFWTQLSATPVPLGISVWMAAALAVIAAVFARVRLRCAIEAAAAEVRAGPFLFKLLFACAAALMLIGVAESRHPPHLPQELDAKVYHMSIPRQHLLQRTAAHLSWSAADLFPMPLQWGFAPAWLMNTTVTKWPQTATAVWLFGLMVAIGRRCRRPDDPAYMGWIPALAVVTSHGVMIQLGTAMMDLPILYCAVAAWHAFQNRRTAWGVFHLALYATSKSFMPFQTTLVLVLAFFLLAAARSLPFRGTVRRCVRPAALLVLLSAGLLARSAIVAWPVAGTPLFPFFVCADASVPGCVDGRGEKIVEIARQHLETRDAYGNGRSLAAFVMHPWRVSVPTKGVNNEFDYPLGLPWLIGLILLALSLAVGVRDRRVPVASAVALASWAVWWAGSQQARWLYPVIVFSWLGAVGVLRLVQRRLLLGVLALSAVFSLIAQTRALRSSIAVPSAVIQSGQQARVSRNAGGEITDRETLYVNEPIISHQGSDPLWIIGR